VSKSELAMIRKLARENGSSVAKYVRMMALKKGRVLLSDPVLARQVGELGKTVGVLDRLIRSLRWGLIEVQKQREHEERRIIEYVSERSPNNGDAAAILAVNRPDHKQHSDVETLITQSISNAYQAIKDIRALVLKMMSQNR